MAIAPDSLRDAWWKLLPTRQQHGIANTAMINAETDLCGICGVCRWRHFQSDQLNSLSRYTVAYSSGHVGSDWRIAYFVGDYDKPVDFFEQDVEGNVTDKPLAPIQVIPARPLDTTP